eukprot:sb/3469562/
MSWTSGNIVQHGRAGSSPIVAACKLQGMTGEVAGGHYSQNFVGGLRAQAPTRGQGRVPLPLTHLKPNTNTNTIIIYIPLLGLCIVSARRTPFQSVDLSNAPTTNKPSKAQSSGMWRFLGPTFILFAGRYGVVNLSVLENMNHAARPIPRNRNRTPTRHQSPHLTPPTLPATTSRPQGSGNALTTVLAWLHCNLFTLRVRSSTVAHDIDLTQVSMWPRFSHDARSAKD